MQLKQFLCSLIKTAHYCRHFLEKEGEESPIAHYIHTNQCNQNNNLKFIMQYTTSTKFTTNKQKIKHLEDNHREIIKIQGDQWIGRRKDDEIRTWSTFNTWTMIRTALNGDGGAVDVVVSGVKISAALLQDLLEPFELKSR